MAQMTKDLAESSLAMARMGQMPPLTAHESAQLLRVYLAWLDAPVAALGYRYMESEDDTYVALVVDDLPTGAEETLKHQTVRLILDPIV